MEVLVSVPKSNLSESSPSESSPSESSPAELSRSEIQNSASLLTPDRLQAYETIETGLAAKMVDAIAEQQTQRGELTKAIVQADQHYSATFLMLGFGLLCFSLGTSTYLIWSGHEVIGGLIAGGSLITALTLGICSLALQAKKHGQQLRSLSDVEVQTSG